MTVVIFIIVLAVLIFAHELGHFLAAKATGMRVDEFGIGFPPKLLSWRKGETLYSINLIPFGGFVKIYGEDYDEDQYEQKKEDSLLTTEHAVKENRVGIIMRGFLRFLYVIDMVIGTNLAGHIADDVLELDKPLDPQERNFARKPKWAQALVLVSGVVFNIILAWILISVGFMSGLPSSASSSASYDVSDPRLLITAVLPGSPAEEAELKAGDEIVSLRAGEVEVSEVGSVEEAQAIIKGAEEELLITVMRDEDFVTATLVPEEGVIEGQRAIGVGLDMVGTAKLPFLQALWEGGKTTVEFTEAVAVGLWKFVADAFSGDADFSQVAGPIGIAGLVGDASRLGFVYLLSFTAIISIHLAVINLVPFPALDGGRLLFVLIEKIKGSPIKPKIANTLNVVGFSLLILLMIVVTVSDVFKLF